MLLINMDRQDRQDLFGLLGKVFQERKQSPTADNKILSIPFIHVNYTGKSIS